MFVFSPQEPKSKGRILYQYSTIVQGERGDELNSWHNCYKLQDVSWIRVRGFVLWFFFFSFLSVGESMSLSVCPVAKVKRKSERVLRVLSSHSVKCRISLSRRSQQVEGRMRMQTKKEQQQKNQSKFERYFTCYPGQDWAENPICGLRNVCVCLRVCMNWCFYTQDDTLVIFPWNWKDYAIFSFFPFFATNLIDELPFLFFFFFLFVEQI